MMPMQKSLGYLIAALMPLVLAYVAGFPTVSQNLPDNLGKGLLVYHQEVNVGAQSAWQHLRNRIL